MEEKKVSKKTLIETEVVVTEPKIEDKEDQSGETKA